jgi:hypothetical protein
VKQSEIAYYLTVNFFSNPSEPHGEQYYYTNLLGVCFMYTFEERWPRAVDGFVNLVEFSEC